jgi:hypothetical protein
MQRGEKGAGRAREQQAIAATRKLLDGMFNYMEKAGVRVRDLGYGKDYFPRIWDPEFISRHQDAFKAMLEKYKTSRASSSGDVER